MPEDGWSFKDKETGTMLRVMLMGHLGADAELRQSARGSQIARFNVALNQLRTSAEGEPQESAEWFRISVVGRQAEWAGQLQKGQRVVVDGRLQISHFQRRDGTPGIGFDVWADEVQNVTARSSPEADDGRTAVGAGAADELLDDADLPF
jgi:single-strand DNA-binding protein